MDEATKYVFYTAINIILQATIPVLVVAASTWLISKARLYWGEFKKTQPDAAAVVVWAASIAVDAAEQAGMAGLIKDKKAYALQVAQAFIKAKGVNIDLIALDGAIESLVFANIGRSEPDELDDPEL